MGAIQPCAPGGSHPGPRSFPYRREGDRARGPGTLPCEEAGVMHDTQQRRLRSRRETRMSSSSVESWSAGHCCKWDHRVGSVPQQGSRRGPARAVSVGRWARAPLERVQGITNGPWDRTT